MAEAQSITTEQWRPVVGYEDLYEVSSHGQVNSLPRYKCRGGLLRQLPNRWGYLNVHLCANGRMRSFAVHILVIRAFRGPCPTGLETRHLDDNKSNNTISNLVYGTKSENAQDRLRHGNHDQANKTHCPKGHPYDATNTGIAPSRYCRYCKTCKREKKRIYDQRKRLMS